MESQPVLYPHEVLAFLFNQCGLAIPATDVRAYWQHARSMGEPWSLETTASNYHIPCGLYGDAARLSTVYAAEKIVGVFLNLPLFRPKSVRASRWLLWSCSAFKVYSNRTFNKVFRVLCWSLNFAYQGIYPTHTLQGTPLGTPEAGKALTSDNLSFAVTELRGDWSGTSWSGDSRIATGKQEPHVSDVLVLPHRQTTRACYTIQWMKVLPHGVVSTTVFFLLIWSLCKVCKNDPICTCCMYFSRKHTVQTRNGWTKSFPRSNSLRKG